MNPLLEVYIPRAYIDGIVWTKDVEKIRRKNWMYGVWPVVMSVLTQRATIASKSVYLLVFKGEPLEVLVVPFNRILKEPLSVGLRPCF